MSKHKYLFGNSPVSLIYFLDSKVNLYTKITFLARVLNDTNTHRHKRVYFYSTGR